MLSASARASRGFRRNKVTINKKHTKRRRPKRNFKTILPSISKINELQWTSNGNRNIAEAEKVLIINSSSVILAKAGIFPFQTQQTKIYKKFSSQEWLFRRNLKYLS